MRPAGKTAVAPCGRYLPARKAPDSFRALPCQLEPLEGFNAAHRLTATATVGAQCPASGRTEVERGNRSHLAYAVTGIEHMSLSCARSRAGFGSDLKSSAWVEMGVGAVCGFVFCALRPADWTETRSAKAADLGPQEISAWRAASIPYGALPVGTMPSSRPRSLSGNAKRPRLHLASPARNKRLLGPLWWLQVLFLWPAKAGKRAIVIKAPAQPQRCRVVPRAFRARAVDRP